MSAELTLEFPADGYSLDSIQRAAYRYVDRLDVEIASDAALFRCVLRARAAHQLDDELVAEFRAEVLDQVLRERIRAETAEARNVVLALAFSNLPPPSQDAT